MDVSRAIVVIITRTKVIGNRRNRRILILIRQVAAAICSCMFWLGVRPLNFPFPGGQGPHHVNPLNSLGRGHECDRQHATEKCVAIAARVIPPGNLSCAVNNETSDVPQLPVKHLLQSM